MSLLEEWDAGSSFQEPAQGFTLDDEGLAVPSDPLPLASPADHSIFGLHTIDRQLSRYNQRCEVLNPENLIEHS